MKNSKKITKKINKKSLYNWGYIILIIILVGLILYFGIDLIIKKTSEVSQFKNVQNSENAMFSGYKGFNSDETLGNNVGKWSYKKSHKSRFVTVPLTAPNSDDDSPTNLMTGQLNRYYSEDNGKTETRFEIVANLLVLDGNVFNGEDVEHSYKAFLANNNNDDIFQLGTLMKDGDGLYKLQVVYKDEDFDKFDTIAIVYQKEDKVQLVLVGSLN